LWFSKWRQIPVELMHTNWLGLLKKIIKMLGAIIKAKYGKPSTVRDLINRRIANTPRFIGVRAFYAGIFDMANVTADEWRDLGLILPYALVGLELDGFQEVVVAHLNWYVDGCWCALVCAVRSPTHRAS